MDIFIICDWKSLGEGGGGNSLITSKLSSRNLQRYSYANKHEKLVSSLRQEVSSFASALFIRNFKYPGTFSA